MALADFFGRNAVAVSQVIAGFDEATFTDTISSATIGLTFGIDVAESWEGRCLLDMSVRLLARLYPTVILNPGRGAEQVAEQLSSLATSINPKINIGSPSEATKTIAVGTEFPSVANAAQVVYAGCNGWDAHVSEIEAKPTGCSKNPFGAGAAAALACGKVFSLIFAQDAQRVLFSPDLTLSVLDGAPTATQDPLLLSDVCLADGTVLVGLGAIGNAVVWAFTRSDVRGALGLIDHEHIELSNLQRYTLTLRGDEGRLKVEHLASQFNGRLRPLPYAAEWSSFVSANGYEWDQVIVALDSARDRRSVQASLPRMVVNGWTQQGDLGVSEHGRFGGPGACLSCLYLPSGVVLSEDVVVADALRVPELALDVRRLLYQGLPVPDEILALIGQRLGIPADSIERFRGVPIRRLYVEGLCGGALVSPSSLATPRELHVPIAHQSALAGILLAAAAIRQQSRPRSDSTSVTRIDIMKPGSNLTQPARADERGLCICRDADYVVAYDAKWN